MADRVWDKRAAERGEERRVQILVFKTYVEGIEEEPTERWSRRSRKVFFDGKASPPYDKARGMDGHGGWDKRVATSKNVSDMSREGENPLFLMCAFLSSSKAPAFITAKGPFRILGATLLERRVWRSGAPGENTNWALNPNGRGADILSTPLRPAGSGCLDQIV